MKMFTMLFFLSISMLVSPIVEAQAVSFQTQPMLQVSSTIPGRASVPNDLNGDGLSEMLFFSPDSSRLQIGFFSLNQDESVLQRSMVRTINITPGYVVGAIGDLDGDGKSDLVFTSPKRDLYLWKSVGDGTFVSRFIDMYPENWTLLGSADMDGDGTDDLLWLNATTCQFAYWSFKQGNRKSAATFAVDCSYEPVAIGYYALTNRASIIWTDPAHNLVVWDSVADGFNHSSLGSYPGYEFVYRLGGGDQGRGMSLMTASADNMGFTHRDFIRNFSIDGKQSSWAKGTFGGGGKDSMAVSGGFMVRAQGFGGTGRVDYYLRSYTYDPLPGAWICVPSKQEYDSYAMEPNTTCGEFKMDAGWVPIGSGVALGKLSATP